VARPDFQDTWVPRIGEEATAELRRYRYVVGLGPFTMCVFCGAAGLVFGKGTLYDLLSVALVAVAVRVFVAFLRSQRRFAEALSYWFGVRIQAGQLPIMNPSRFDAWREKRGLRSPGGRTNGPVGRVPLESMTLMRWDFPAPPGLWPGEQMLWSGIGYISRPKSGHGYTSRPQGWHEGTLYVTSGRVMFSPVRLGNIGFKPPEVQRFQLSDFLSVKLEDQGPATPDSGRERQRLEFTFRDEQSLLVAVDKPDEVLGELRALLPVRQGV
jgi:hypothetical protein